MHSVEGDRGLAAGRAKPLDVLMTVCVTIPLASFLLLEHFNWFECGICSSWLHFHEHRFPSQLYNMLNFPHILFCLFFIRTAFAALCQLRPLGRGRDDTDQVSIPLYANKIPLCWRVDLDRAGHCDLRPLWDNGLWGGFLQCYKVCDSGRSGVWFVSLISEAGKWCGIWRTPQSTCMAFWVYVSMLIVCQFQFWCKMHSSILIYSSGWIRQTLSGWFLFRYYRCEMSLLNADYVCITESGIMVRCDWIRLRHWCPQHRRHPRERTGKQFNLGWFEYL